MSSASQLEAAGAIKHVWYRSPIYAAFIIGICNFCAPGLWTAMNAIGGGGQATPFLVNAANALTFTLMVGTAFLGSTVLNVVGVNWALFLGAAGYAPYVAGLYTNTVYGTKWLMLFGATTCGISAGLFWAIEASVAFAYPEPDRLGRFLGIWTSFSVGGKLVGGAINLGMNANRGTAGSINPKVFLVFVALQAAGPFTAFLLPRPDQVQRRDGKSVKIYSDHKAWDEIKATWRVLLSKEILLLVPFIVQGLFPQSWVNTYMGSHFTVRVRSLGAFVAAVACVIISNVVGKYLDLNRVSLKTRARYTFIWFMVTRGGWWIWALVLESNFPSDKAIDWTSPLFGKTFALYVLFSANLQGLFMYTYFLCKNVCTTHEDEARVAGLLRAVQSAAMAVAYGTSSVKSFAHLGSAWLNFALWGVAIVPSWFVIRRIGIDLSGPVAKDDENDEGQVAHLPQSDNASSTSSSEEKK